MSEAVNAIIRLSVPEWQLGHEVSVYFPDTMVVKAIVEPAVEAIPRPIASGRGRESEPVDLNLVKVVATVVTTSDGSGCYRCTESKDSIIDSALHSQFVTIHWPAANGVNQHYYISSRSICAVYEEQVEMPISVARSCGLC